MSSHLVSARCSFLIFFVSLLLQVNSACARARSQDGPSPDTLPEVAQLLVEVRIRAEDVLRSFPDLRQSPFPPYDPTVTIDEEEYARRIKYGKLATCQVDKDGKRMGGRLEIGDLTWLYTFEVSRQTIYSVEDDPSSLPLAGLLPQTDHASDRGLRRVERVARYPCSRKEDPRAGHRVGSTAAGQPRLRLASHHCRFHHVGGEWSRSGSTRFADTQVRLHLWIVLRCDD